MSTSTSMTSKDRWLAALHMQPVDRLPFWPKLDAAYPGWRTGRFVGMPLDEIHDFIGSDKHVWIAHGLVERRTKTSVKKEEAEAEIRRTYRTPRGSMHEVYRFDEASAAWHPIEFPIKTREDLALMMEVYADAETVFDEKILDDSRRQAREIGSDALIAGTIGTSPLMWFVEHLAGVENAHLFLADYPGEVEALFDAMQRVNVRHAELLADEHPADIFYMVENTSTSLISPTQFRTYSMPQLREVTDILNARDRLMVYHMCGLLKDLLPDIATLGAAGVEAFTAPTLGNTTLLDGRTACPELCLVGGTQATFWTKPAEDIIARIDEALAPLPHYRGIVVTSAGVMPPMCEPETIKTVCEWVHAYNPKC